MDDRRKTSDEELGKSRAEDMPLLLTPVPGDLNGSQPLEKLPYPKSVAFIIGNEFCERFSFYGMKTVLFVFLTSYLAFESHRARSAVHFFGMLAYLFPLIGGILSDSYLGKFYTILYLSIVYCIGNIVLSVTALPGVMGGDVHAVPPVAPPWWGTALGLVLLAIGTGGIKPCVSAFGGDQFHPSQVVELQTFFSMFYFSINAGSVLSTFITPELRSMYCMGMKSCFPLAFGVPAVLMIVATIVFVSGYKLYKIIPPGGNVLLKTIRVVRTAVSERWKTPRADRNGRSFLSYAEEEHGVALVRDTRSLFSVLYMFLPLPLFWTLFDQQSSFWVEQAQKMGATVEIFGGQFTVKAEQMQLTNALLILIMIPLFDRGIYPLIARYKISFLPLKRMAYGMLLTGISFIIAAFLEWKMENSEIHKDPDTSEWVCTANCINIMWQVPQYVVITAGEILFSITGIEFAYSQAPKSMKSVCQAAWLLTVAFGNLIVVLVAESTLFDAPYKELFFYAGMIFVAMFVFGGMAMRYKYVDHDNDGDASSDIGSKTSSEISVTSPSSAANQAVTAPMDLTVS